MATRQVITAALVAAVTLMACCAASNGERELPTDGAEAMRDLADSMEQESVDKLTRSPVDIIAEVNDWHPGVSEVLEKDVPPDVGDVETDPSYHLGNAEPPKGAKVDICSSYDPKPLPLQSRLFAIPYVLRYMPDGVTLRVGLFWLNGYDAFFYYGDYSGGPINQLEHNCWLPVDGVLPSGLVYYDIDTITDEATFLGEIVFTPATVANIRGSWPNRIEYLNDLAHSGSLSECVSTTNGFGLCVAVGNKEYILPMCQHESPCNMFEPCPTSECVYNPVKCMRGCNEHGPSPEEVQPGEVGFVDLEQRSLHLLLVRDGSTGKEETIPLTVAGDLIPRAQAVRSGCVVEEDYKRPPHYLLGNQRPFYKLGRWHDEDPMSTSEAFRGLGFVYSLEEYLAAPPTEPLVPESVWSQDVAYRDPFYPESGAIFLPITWSPINIVHDDIGEVVELHEKYGTATSLNGWNASGSWYMFSGLQWYAQSGQRYVACSSDPADGMCTGQHCFTLNSSLLSGNKTKIVSEILEVSGAELLMEENDVWEMYGTEMLRFSLKFHSSMTAEEVLETYPGLVPSFVQPGQQACRTEFHFSLPLLDYAY